MPSKVLGIAVRLERESIKLMATSIWPIPFPISACKVPTICHHSKSVDKILLVSFVPLSPAPSSLSLSLHLVTNLTTTIHIPVFLYIMRIGTKFVLFKGFEMGFSSKEEKSKRILRVVKTLFFLITMFLSLLLFSAPVLLVIADALLPSALLSTLSVSPLSLTTLSSHFNNYDFRYSLIDIPLLSIIRSFIIFCKFNISRKFEFFIDFRWPFWILILIMFFYRCL